MLRRTPMLAKVQNSEVPPEEIKGKGIPLVGTRESTTRMLKKAWSRMLVVMPKATRGAKGSCERKAVRKPRQPKTAKRITTQMAPMNPNSSAMLAKMKSVEEIGRA